MTTTDDTTTEDTAEWVEDTEDDESEDTTASADDETDDNTDDDEEDEDGQPTKGVRARLKEAEQERDELRHQLAWTREVAFLEACRAAGLDSDLAIAKGVSVGDHLDGHGTVNTDSLATALEGARSKMSVPRRPKPVSQAGKGWRRRGQATGDVRSHSGRAREAQPAVLGTNSDTISGSDGPRTVAVARPSTR